ncbi:MAG: type II toxin-antitoxin system PemK/MazF family toxin [Bdellovibrionales bacterium]|nr:type II toxin-antitoxin system PemK/MazF family toxin [Bdellovibrionales bacterium]
MSTYKIFDIVVVPFPFTDKRETKNRPALVISESDQKTRTLAMITSAVNATWKFDVPISDLEKSGLYVPCKVRMKLFTLDEGLIKKKVGHLEKKDQIAVKAKLKKYLKL